ncbi:SDR family NAD(P)-dependent oxidoreductase [Streptomyces sp. AJS327]|uniref:SDR family NAD(P)-dependent oxidoreductase n=1 Tax=Streptomyces sp. AJS327 TaxID=2545265 RepID=UPI0015DE153E|nr:SDR family NAD(P)-dependent oxidoreductase [Streptomyces sp. AJS327]MBA0050975.1 SDR family NAD(P)-dependent oxidoreductase [Streptomyces sp. AJS327]
MRTPAIPAGPPRAADPGPGPAPDPGPGDGVRPVRRMVWRLTPAPAGGAQRALTGRRTAVIGGTPALAARVRDALRARGAEVAGEREEAGGPVPSLLVDLTLAEPFTPAAAGRWREALPRTVDWLRHCYARWSAETATGSVGYIAVTYLGGGMGQHPDDDLAQPLGGLWAGLAKTLHRELPNCAARVLDTSLGDLAALPERIVEEAGRTGLTEIGHRDGRRWTLTPETPPPGPPAVRWTAADTVLVSGGGRGLGMALARALTREFGLRAVVTGRTALPPEESWEAMTPKALDARRAELWAGHRAGRPVADIRRDIVRAEGLWEVVGNLRSARAEGLRVDYLPCDVTDPEAVRALVAGLPGLTAVVHNAGLDRPARLPRKSDADIAEVVSVKVDAFVHLVEAVRDRELKVLCAVGSLTGRLGGMVGQFDYAAANDCLARLGRWAQRRVTFPVQVLAWPTWARLGLIANYEASLRYMAALAVEEGLAHWRAELLAGTSGEVSFVGPLGRALDPVQAVGYPMPPSLPGYRETYPRVFHLGTPETYAPGERLSGHVQFDAASAPVLRDFTVRGAPALPVGLLLESAARAAEWLLPPDGEPALLAVEELTVPWSLLRCGPDGRLRLHRALRLGPGTARPDGTAAEGERWSVEAVFRPAPHPPEESGPPEHDGPPGVEGGPEGAGGQDGAGGQEEEPVARFRLVFGAAPHTAPSGPPARPAARPASGPVLLTGEPVLRWRGLAVPLAGWRPDGPGRSAAEVRRCHPEDLWALPQPPALALPLAPIENVVRAVTRRVPGLSSTPDPLVLHALRLHGPEPERTRISADPALGVWRITATDGSPVAVLEGPPTPS